MTLGATDYVTIALGATDFETITATHETITATHYHTRCNKI